MSIFYGLRLAHSNRSGYSEVETMMIDKRLIGTVPESKKYIAANVALQWCGFVANVAMMMSVASLLAGSASTDVC